jgi:hypothetical protein
MAQRMTGIKYFKVTYIMLDVTISTFGGRGHYFFYFFAKKFFFPPVLIDKRPIKRLKNK